MNEVKLLKTAKADFNRRLKRRKEQKEQEELQNKRKSFISKYAYRDDLWVNDWKKQILGLANVYENDRESVIEFAEKLSKGIQDVE